MAKGGVTLAYRRRLIDAPSYTLNHQEANLALQGGYPLRGEPDAQGGRTRPTRHAAALIVSNAAGESSVCPRAPF